MPSQIWILFVIVQCINGAFWWFRGIAERPEQRDSYKKLVIGWSLFGNIPWLIIGAGALSNKLSSLDEIFHPSRGNPFVLGFHISVIVLLTLNSYWIYFGKGAQTMIEHPGLLNRPITEPKHLKLLWSACLAGAVFGEIFMWVPK